MFTASKVGQWSATPVANLGQYRSFDVAPDGKRVLSTLPSTAPESGHFHVTVLLNFFDELKRRLP